MTITFHYDSDLFSRGGIANPRAACGAPRITYNATNAEEEEDNSISQGAVRTEQQICRFGLPVREERHQQMSYMIENLR